ncbi:MAG: hypothetical protein CMK07_15115 [Ponticaulis sp.]|nr:hypothetical protein [Ponticaulis sp.]
MGFYAPAQIVRDAREHGVEVRPVDVNFSEWDSVIECSELSVSECSVAHPSPAAQGDLRLHSRLCGAPHDQGSGADAASETRGNCIEHNNEIPRSLVAPEENVGGKSFSPSWGEGFGMRGAQNNEIIPILPIRLGFRQVTGLREEEVRALIAARGKGYESVEDIRRRSGISRRAVELLAAADAFGSIDKSRREALWDVRGEAADKTLPLFAAADAREQGGEKKVELPEMPASEHVVQDYQTTRLSLKAHPMSFLRERYRQARICSTAEAVALGNGRRVDVAGVVLVRQRPGSASGVVFMTIEDETGVANIVVWPKIMKRDRAIVMGARIVQIKGYVQYADNVTHIVANRLIDRTNDLSLLSEDFQNDPLKGAIANADEVMRPIPENRQSAHPRNVRIMPRSRDFH